MNICEIKDPAFLRRMDEKELQKLCGELREFIIEGVSHTGGHLSSNLGSCIESRQCGADGGAAPRL